MSSKTCMQQRLWDYRGSKDLLVRRFQREGRGWVGLPMTDGEMGLWSDIGERLPVAVLPRAMVPVVTDKTRFKAFMLGLGHGAHVPTRYADKASIQYPCVLKLDAKDGSGGSGVSIEPDEQSLVERLGSVPFDHVLVEEFVPSSTEYSVNVVGMRGAAVSLEECVRMQTKHDRFVITGSPAGSPESRTFVKCSELPRWDTVRRVSADLVRALNFTGLGFIQLKYDASGAAKFVEMNGRPDGMLLNNNRPLFAELLRTLYRAGAEAGVWDIEPDAAKGRLW